VQPYEVGVFLGMERKPLLMLEDNKAVIDIMSRGYCGSSHSRHINIRYFYLCDKVKSGEIIVEYISTKEQLADL
jgi:hypothetical protein